MTPSNPGNVNYRPLDSREAGEGSRQRVKKRKRSRNAEDQNTIRLNTFHISSKGRREEPTSSQNDRSTGQERLATPGQHSRAVRNCATQAPHYGDWKSARLVRSGQSREFAFSTALPVIPNSYASVRTGVSRDRKMFRYNKRFYILA